MTQYAIFYLSANIDGYADYHSRDGDAGYEGDAHWGPHQCAELPEDLLLSAPGFLPPKGAARRTERIIGKELILKVVINLNK